MAQRWTNVGVLKGVTERIFSDSMSAEAEGEKKNQKKLGKQSCTKKLDAQGDVTFM